jgi:transcriptional regulator with XRE-family HTH domain
MNQRKSWMEQKTVGQFTVFVGRRIRLRRQRRKMTQFELAKKVGVPVSILSRVEAGTAHINLEQLMRFVGVFTSTHDLLGLPHIGEEATMRFMDEKINAMSEEQLRAWKAKPREEMTDSGSLFILDFDEKDE